MYIFARDAQKKNCAHALATLFFPRQWTLRTRLAALESWESKIENQMEELKKDHKSDQDFNKKKEKFEEETSLAELEKTQEEMAWLKMTLGASNHNC